MSSTLRDHLDLLSSYIPEDHETLPFIILPILFHLVVLSYLYSYRKSDGAVLAVALFSLSQALFASAPTSFCAVIFAPKHFTKEQQSSWSMSFFALPALGTSLVALLFLLITISRSLDSLAKARVDAERRAIKKKEGTTAGGEFSGSLPPTESKKDI
ncbi:hypothetical protein BDY24DRAFT_380482 [Mrakia frigida]|uniref:uncharacterized protein n=1 Tax=Mrakia frigida TaxID=29902 RepID=UPI003FCC11C5